MAGQQIKKENQYGIYCKKRKIIFCCLLSGNRKKASAGLGVILEPEQILKVLEFTNRPEYYDYYLIHCAVLIAIGCTVRGGEIGGLQWDKINFEKQIIHFDRAIDRVSKKNMDMPKMNILFKFPNLYPGTKTTIVLKQPKSDDTVRDVDVPQSVLTVSYTHLTLPTIA